MTTAMTKTQERKANYEAMDNNRLVTWYRVWRAAVANPDATLTEAVRRGERANLRIVKAELKRRNACFCCL